MRPGGPADCHGPRVVHLTVHSAAVGEDLGMSVVVLPEPAGGRGGRALLVFLHGRSGSEETLVEDEAVFRGLARLGRRAPIWVGYGTEDPFRVYDEGFVEAPRAGGADLSAHSWQGEHDSAHWDRHRPSYLRFYAAALARGVALLSPIA